MKKTLSIKYPIENSLQGYYFDMTTNSIDAELSKLKFFLTVGGGLIYNPNYGINLNKYLFEPFDDITFKNIEDQIKTKIKQYFSQIEVESIIFVVDNSNSIINFQFELIINNQKTTFILNQ